MLLLPAVLTSREAHGTLALLDGTLRSETGPGPVVVDASRLQSFDTSALAVLIELARSARAWQRTCVVRSVPPRLRDLARLYGVEGVLGPEAAGGGTAEAITR